MARLVALYTRVSTVGQSCAAQEQELREIADRSGWNTVGVYSDHGISGAKGRKDRPALDRLLRDAARRRFDLLAATAVDKPVAPVKRWAAETEFTFASYSDPCAIAEKEREGIAKDVTGAEVYRKLLGGCSLNCEHVPMARPSNSAGWKASCKVSE